MVHSSLSFLSRMQAVYEMSTMKYSFDETCERARSRRGSVAATRSGAAQPALEHDERRLLQQCASFVRLRAPLGDCRSGPPHYPELRHNHCAQLPCHSSTPPNFTLCQVVPTLPYILGCHEERVHHPSPEVRSRKRLDPLPFRRFHRFLYSLNVPRIPFIRTSASSL